MGAAGVQEDGWYAGGAGKEKGGKGGGQENVGGCGRPTGTGRRDEGRCSRGRPMDPGQVRGATEGMHAVQALVER